MMRPKRERPKCLECRKPFTIVREYANRRAVIKFCPDCREIVSKARAALERHQAWRK